MSIMKSTLFKRLRRSRLRTDPGCVAWKDDLRAGWFCNETRELAPGFAISDQDTYIDVGCGEGTMSRFAGSMGAAVIATDIDQACVDATVRRTRRTKARSVEGFVSDSNPIPVDDATCTRVLCMEVMEHVDDPAQFMTELVRVAKPNALFLLSVPDPASEAIQKDLAPEVYWRKPNHLRVFEHSDFAATVSNAGLIVEKQFYRSFFWAMYWSLFWAADQQFGAPEKPVLQNWRMTWDALLECPTGNQVKATLDRTLPKSQVILARKPA